MTEPKWASLDSLPLPLQVRNHHLGRIVAWSAGHAAARMRVDRALDKLRGMNAINAQFVELKMKG